MRREERRRRPRNAGRNHSIELIGQTRRRRRLRGADGLRALYHRLRSFHRLNGCYRTALTRITYDRLPSSHLPPCLLHIPPPRSLPASSSVLVRCCSLAALLCSEALTRGVGVLCLCCLALPRASIHPSIHAGSNCRTSLLFAALCTVSAALLPLFVVALLSPNLSVSTAAVSADACRPSVRCARRY